MEILTPTYTYEELTGATRLLENMCDNCIKKDTDTYDDPDRERKYEALNIAIDAIKKLPVKKRRLCFRSQWLAKLMRKLLQQEKRLLQL